MSWIQQPGACYPAVALQIACGREHMAKVRAAREAREARAVSRQPNPLQPEDEPFFAPAGPVYGKFDWVKRYAPEYTHPGGHALGKMIIGIPEGFEEPERAANPIPTALLPLIMVAGRRDSSKWQRITPASRAPAPTPAGLICPPGQYLVCPDGIFHGCHCIKGARAWRWWEQRPSPLDPNPAETQPTRSPALERARALVGPRLKAKPPSRQARGDRLRKTAARRSRLVTRRRSA